MTDTTTIQLDRETKRQLDALKLDGETYDAAVARLVDDQGVLMTEADVRAIAHEEAEAVVDDLRRR